MINRLRTWLKGSQPDLYAILDIGTVEAKALLLLVEGERAAIVGAGKHPYEAGAMARGQVADLKLATDACERALSQAETESETVVGEKLVADKVVVGIPGSMLVSVAESLSVRRLRPQQPLTEKELRGIVLRAERAVLQEGRELAAKGPGGSGSEMDVGLIDADILHVVIDGLPLGTLSSTRGAQVDMRVCTLFAPADYLKTIGLLAHALELEVTAVRSTTCAIARAPYVTGRGDAIIVDVGGECTDVVVVRHGGIDGLRSMPLGAVAFTRRTGRAFGVPLPAAEEIKRAYAGGQLDAERSAELRSALASDVSTWIGGVQAALAELAADNDLPAAMYVSGGGAALPDVERALRKQRWLHVLPFAHEPQVTMLRAAVMSGLEDQAHLANSDSFVGALALATRTARSARTGPTSQPQQALNHVLHGMGLL